MDYFRYWKPEEDFPPHPVVQPEQARNSERLNVACTQTTLPPLRRRKIVAEWCELFPTLTNVRLLWLSSKVPQALFEAACRVPNLEGLYVKWSGISDLAPLAGARKVRWFHLGQTAQLGSIEPLATMSQLRWLGLELLSRVHELDPVGSLVDLEGLSLEGSIGTTWRVQTLRPLRHLEGLRYLSIANLRTVDRTLSPLFSLSKLVSFRHASWWERSELDEIRRRNPQLAA